MPRVRSRLKGATAASLAACWSLGCHAVAGIEDLRYDPCAQADACSNPVELVAQGTAGAPPIVVSGPFPEESSAGAGGALPVALSGSSGAAGVGRTSTECTSHQDCIDANGSDAYSCVNGQCLSAAQTDVSFGDVIEETVDDLCEAESWLKCYGCSSAWREALSSGSSCFFVKIDFVQCLAGLPEDQFECTSDASGEVRLISGNECSAKEEALRTCLSGK